ncbi:MAG: PAS domain-containing sensor histidine kinase [Afipia sp. 62-7]|nr:PAS domain S-box protein [Afipia sp.]OJU14903.1 MAG: PAS domain-containing sensor histidine kinase [Afipia sp. 62-7]
MRLSVIIRDHLDSLLHPSARHDPMTSARHRAFIGPRLLGGLAALATLPIYLALRGAPQEIEVMVFAWLIAPILLSYYLSRTGNYERAHILSSTALAAVVTAVCAYTGGISSFAAIWLVAVPLDAALSTSRRAVAVAVVLALGCALGLVMIEAFGLLPVTRIPAQYGSLFEALGIATATMYASALAFSAEALSRTSRKLLVVEEARYRLLAHNISDVISRHSRNGAIQFISPAAEGLLGTPAALLLEHGLFDRVHVADRPAYLTALSEAARSGEERSVEFRIRRDVIRGHDQRGSSEFIWIEMRCRSIETSASDSSGTEVVAVMRDVTERKTQERALELAHMEAERAGASKSRFLATMSHELRTPLNAIIGFSEMIVHEKDMMIDAARRQEYAKLINESGLHLLSVVNGILDMSKMESGNFEISPEPFMPRESLVSCCNLMVLKARENGIEVVTRAPQDLPQITGDPRAFKQMILNLLSNAIKFSEQGGKVVVAASVEGPRLVVRVTDSGIGIGAEDLKRIGDPFFQAGKTYQRRHEGTGLGLSIVKSLVAMHGGEMLVESRIGEGTTVTVALPMVFTPPLKDASDNVAPLVRSRGESQDYQVKKIA